jgi:catechol 2,3-dioxygenase-like lactoylglutathione lyase family enzyme
MRFRHRPSRPSVTIASPDPDRLKRFFADLGWAVTDDVVESPGGRFAVSYDDAPPRLELALNLPDPLLVDVLSFVVEEVGGILMEPVQETVGGWGCSFNDPDGNTWELGAPHTITFVDASLRTHGRAPVGCPIVALAVPRRRLPEIV